MFKVIAAILLSIICFSALGDENDSITVAKQAESLSTISLQPLEHATIKIKVPRIEDGVNVAVDCDQACSDLVRFSSKSGKIRNESVDFSVVAQGKIGSQVITFRIDKASYQAKIDVTMPHFSLTVKGAAPDGKPFDLMIDQVNAVSVEVKKGDEPVADGTYVEASVQNAHGLSDDALSFTDKEVRTKGGLATFHLKPKVEDGTATVQFKVKDSDSTAELNVKTSSISYYQALVQKVTDQLFGYIAILAAIGTAAFGLLEALKWGDRIKGYVQALLFVEHLKQPQSTEAVPGIIHIWMNDKNTDADVEKIETDIIASAYGVFDESRRKIFHRQKIETIVSSTVTACEKVLDGAEMGRQNLLAFINDACPMVPIGTDPDKLKKELDRRKANLKAYFEAVQVDIAARWAGYNQLAAMVLSVILTVIIAWTSGALSGYSVETVVLAFVGGLFAPFAKDIKTNAGSLIGKLTSS